MTLISLTLTSPFLITLASCAPLIPCPNSITKCWVSHQPPTPSPQLPSHLSVSFLPSPHHLHFHLNCLRSFLAIFYVPSPAPLLSLFLPTSQRDAPKAELGSDLILVPTTYWLLTGPFPSPPYHLLPLVQTLLSLQLNWATHFIPHLCSWSSFCQKCPSCFLFHSALAFNSFGEYSLSTCHMSSTMKEGAVIEMNEVLPSRAYLLLEKADSEQINLIISDSGSC